MTEQEKKWKEFESRLDVLESSLIKLSQNVNDLCDINTGQSKINESIIELLKNK